MTAQPLSRRDRAALVLALECVRARCAGDTQDALGCGGPVARAIRKAWMLDAWSGLLGSRRVFRARLALLLRAILRADAGDYGDVACERCGYMGDGTHGWGDYCGECWVQCREPVGKYRPRRYTPLWEIAAARKAAP